MSTRAADAIWASAEAAQTPAGRGRRKRCASGYKRPKGRADSSLTWGRDISSIEACRKHWVWIYIGMPLLDRSMILLGQFRADRGPGIAAAACPREQLYRPRRPYPGRRRSGGSVPR